MFILTPKWCQKQASQVDLIVRSNQSATKHLALSHIHDSVEHKQRNDRNVFNAQDTHATSVDVSKTATMVNSWSSREVLITD